VSQGGTVLEARSVLIMTIAAALMLVALVLSVAHSYSLDEAPNRLCDGSISQTISGTACDSAD